MSRNGRALFLISRSRLQYCTKCGHCYVLNIHFFSIKIRKCTGMANFLPIAHENSNSIIGVHSGQLIKKAENVANWGNAAIIGSVGVDNFDSLIFFNSKKFRATNKKCYFWHCQ